MKKVIMVLLSMMLSVPALAANELVKVTALSSELSILNAHLEDARSRQKGDVIKMSISFASALTLGLINYKIHQMDMKRPLGMEEIQSRDARLFNYYLATGIAVYGAANGVNLVLNINEIPTIQKLIEEKQKELTAAQAVLKSLEE